MNIDIENKDLEKEEKSKDNFITNFLESLNNMLKKENDKEKDKSNNIEESKEISLLENEKYIVRDINDNNITVINVSDGTEIVENNIDEQLKEDIFLGTTLEVKNGLIIISDRQLKLEDIKNREAFFKLQDMFFSLSQEENEVYSVEEIKDDKIFLSNIEKGGYFSISRKKYLDFKVGNLVQIKNNKYILYKK